MMFSLFYFVSHSLFDWSKRQSPAGLAKNFAYILKCSENVDSVDITKGSQMYKAGQDFVNTVNKHRNKKSLAWILTKEKDLLNKKEFEVVAAETVETEDSDYEYEEVHQQRKKTFKNLQSRTSKIRRINDAIANIDNDEGIENEIVDNLRKRKKSAEGETKEEVDVGVCCLNAMSILGLSETKFDDLRWWLKDMIRRGVDLSNLPNSDILRKTTMKEMIPPDMESGETGASFPLQSALHHTGHRFLERSVLSYIFFQTPSFVNCPLTLLLLSRPDIKSQLMDGDIVKHIAKIGSDSATGHGKRHQKKESKFDEDGSHNSAYQTVLLLLIRGNNIIFRNMKTGGSELLRLFSKTCEKDTQEMMIRNIEKFDKAKDDIVDQVRITSCFPDVLDKYIYIYSMFYWFHLGS
jgi:hypothetical protein